MTPSAATRPEGWWPDTDIDERLVRQLLADLPDELAHVRELPVQFVAEGWDNSVWRVGDELSARVPRRPLAAPLVSNEARWLGEAAAPLPALGIAVPHVVRLSPPGRHPHPWLLVTWVDGELLEPVPPPARDFVVAPLAAALRALHRPAPREAPLNPFRGRDLREMPPPIEEVVDRARTVLGDDVVDALVTVWHDAAEVPPWPGPRAWCHGDLHPRNLVRTAAGGLGVLDFGDLTAGDPAVDHGVLWLALDQEQRSRCRALLLQQEAGDARTPYDAHAFDRGRGWAARFVLGVAGNQPAPFAGTLGHAVAQLLG